MPKVNLLFFFLLISILSYGQDAYQYTKPITLANGWKTGDLKSHSVDSVLIYKLFNQLKSGKNNVHSVLLVKNDQLIIEEYLNGYSQDKTQDLRSVTKSIVSILMGIAIDKGLIENIDDPISKYLKSPVPHKNLDERKNMITIKHLLTMSSGLDCNDWDKKSKGQENKVYRKKDWLQYTLDLPMVNQPGTVSNYCSMGTVLAAEIISQAAGLTIDKVAEQYLFKPLGITNVHWGHTYDKEIISSAKRLYMTPRDMAKIGQLLINKGSFNGIPIVSEKWIDESTTPITKITGIDYGYLWWNLPFKIKDKVVVAITATGNGGQYIMAIPELDMVAVFTGGAYNSQADKLPFAIMQDILLPAFMENN